MPVNLFIFLRFIHAKWQLKMDCLNWRKKNWKNNV